MFFFNRIPVYGGRLKYYGSDFSDGLLRHSADKTGTPS
ncbi:hypothetical protein l11_00280 [Neisseria weaveri LMG 5135]|nr:hypothetical protein l11_00280 [Neisseria weaveri LMG 5135]